MATLPDEAELERLRDLASARAECQALPADLMAKLCGANVEPITEVESKLPERVGPYRVVAERGRGGMGVVYEAIDDELGRRVAVKVLAAGSYSDAKARERFRREARAAANLRHPHVVPVFAAELPETGPPYLVMPLVDGPTLAAWIADQRVLDPRQAAAFARQLADALSAAHVEGIIHRDVKPANVIIDLSDGLAKLTDFGLARWQETAELSSTGTIAGTPNYISPEQIRSPGSIDHRADLYALGATLYECLTGVPPFRGATLDILRMIGESEPVAPRKLNRNIPRDLETIVLKCLEKAPGDRYANAIELSEDLGRFLEGRPIKARPPGSAMIAWKWVRRNRTIATLGAVLVVALLAGSITSFVLWRRAERASATSLIKQHEAEQNLRAALAVVDRFCTRVAQEELLKQPGLQPVRQKLLADAVEHYRGFVAARRNDPAARVDVADALARLSQITLELGGLTEATAMCRDALVLQEQLMQASPGDNRRVAAVAQLHEELSECLKHLRDYKAAATEGTIAAELFKGLGREYRFEYAAALNLAVQAGMFFNMDHSNAQFREVIALLEELLKENPQALNVKAELAAALHTWGSNRMSAEDIPTFERARMLRSELALAEPDRIRTRVGLADTAMNLGVLYKWSGRLAEAQEVYLATIDILRQVVDENPRVVAWRRSLARTHFNLASLLFQQQKYADASTQYEAARHHFLFLVQQMPGDVQAKLDYAFPSEGLARAQLMQGERAKSVATWSETTPVIRELIAAEKGSFRQLNLMVDLVQQHVGLARELDQKAIGDDLVARTIDSLARISEPNGISLSFGYRAELAAAFAPERVSRIVQEWTRKDPQNRDCLAWQARVAAEEGQVERARELFRQASKLDWKPSPSWLQLPQLKPLLASP